MSDSACVTVERESHTALRTSSACPPSQTKRKDDTSPPPGLARFFCGARRSRRACFRRERRASVPGLGVYHRVQRYTYGTRRRCGTAEESRQENNGNGSVFLATETGDTAHEETRRREPSTKTSPLSQLHPPPCLCLFEAARKVLTEEPLTCRYLSTTRESVRSAVLQTSFSLR
ncbi:hypothetical protein SRHO_G00259830 [Serrasalmus rhombeus]